MHYLYLQMYSAIVVLWRVYSFNDCPEAAKELQQVIAQIINKIITLNLYHSDLHFFLLANQSCKGRFKTEGNAILI